MDISIFAPTLLPMAEQINSDLRYICFFILTASIIVRVARAGSNLTDMTQPIVTSALICGLIALLPTLFNAVRDEFWNIAVDIRSQFASSPSATGAQLMQLLAPPSNGTNPFNIGQSIMKAVQFGIGWIIVFIGGVIQLPMLIGQYVMECLCYMFLPIALALFSLDSTKGIGMRYVQQTLAVLAWPIGFAVVDLVGYSLLTSATSAVSAGAIAWGAATEFTPATFILGGIVAIWLILGSIAVPIAMQMLFCSGVPLSSMVGKSIEFGLAAAGLARLLSKPNPPASGPSGGVLGLSGSPTPPTPVIFATSSWFPALMGGVERAALTSSASPSPSPSGLKPALPGPQGPTSASGHTLPPTRPAPFDAKDDPQGDRFAANLRDLNQIALPISY